MYAPMIVTRIVIPMTIIFLPVQCGNLNRGIFLRVGRFFGHMRPLSNFRTKWIKHHPMPGNTLIFYDPVSETRRLLVSKNDNNPVYVYSFPTYKNSTSTPETFRENININNAVFAEDLDNIFYIPSKNPYPNANSMINRMIDIVCGLWTDFAKYGNPTPNGGKEGLGAWNWPACTAWHPYNRTKTLRIRPDMSIRSGEETYLIDCMKYSNAGELCYYFES